MTVLSAAAAASSGHPARAVISDERPTGAPAERVVSGDALVPVIVNGKPLRLRIEPSLPGLPLVAPALALSLDLKKPGFFGFGVGYRIGRETTYGATRVVPFGWDGAKPEKRRVGWMSRPYTPTADGSIGPGGVPDPVVRFVLHPALPGEQTISLPMKGGTGPFGGWSVLDGEVTIDGSPMRVRFDPYHPHSLVNAGGALAIARSHAGAMTPETGRQEIAFGIDRPYRLMTLGTPLSIGGLSLDRIGVRVTDGDIAGRIAEAGAAPEAVDPDEAVVTATRKKPRTNILILGASALARCSSIVFDKPARQIRLTCR